MQQPSLIRAILAGLIASFAMTALGLVATYLGTPSLNWAHALGNFFGGNHVAGYLLFFVGGMVLAVLYVNLLRERLPGTSWKRGLFFATMMWVITGALVAPMLNMGFFMGGVMVALGTLFTYGIYGVILGYLYDA